MSSRLVVALDRLTSAAALELAEKLSGHVWGFKVRLPLLMDGGRWLLIKLQRCGQVIADGKIFDILSSSQDDLNCLANTGVKGVTVHLSQSASALKALADLGEELKLTMYGVSVLTDYSEIEVMQTYHQDRKTVVREMFCKANACGLPGVVCSVADLDDVPDQLQTLVPGFRPTGPGVVGDEQIRTGGFAEMRKADLVVVGRPVVRAVDPLAEVQRMNAGLQAARAVQEA